MTYEEQMRAEFEAEGFDAVQRRYVAGLYGSPQIGMAQAWLREKDADRQRESAMNAKKAEAQAQITLRMVIAAAVASVFSVVIGFLSWMYPHR